MATPTGLREHDRRGAATAAAGDSLRFAFVGSSDPETQQRRGIAFPVSIALHGVAAVALAIVPLLLVDTLPTESAGARAFFIEPIAAPPPPPPPPPARSTAAARTIAKPTATSSGFVAPVEVPTEIKPEDGLDFGIEGGVPGGVEGGVPGGVVGGVVGGLPEAPPPPAALKPVRVGGNVHEPRRIVDVAPVYPKLAVKAGVEGVVIIEATLSERGRVTSATVLRGVPILDEAALEAVRQWVYTPTLLDGVPTPVIMTVTVTFRLTRAAR